MLTVEEAKIRFVGNTDVLDALKYVNMIATKSGVDISQWDCGATFGRAAVGHEVIDYDKNYLNKRFMEEIQKKNRIKKKGFGGFTKELEKSIKEHEKQIAGSSLKGIDSNLTNCERSIDSYRQTLNSYIHQHGEWCRQRQLLEKTVDLVALINEAIEDTPMLEFTNYTNEYIDFVTNKDIVLSEKNEVMGLDYEVNVGTFNLRFFPKSLTVRVYTHQNNPVYTSPGRTRRWHPHVSAEGYPCYGTGTDAFYTYQKKADIKGMLQLTIQILHQYNPAERPYVNLYELYKVKNGIVDKWVLRPGMVTGLNLNQARDLQVRYPNARFAEEPGNVWRLLNPLNIPEYRMREETPAAAQGANIEISGRTVLMSAEQLEAYARQLTREAVTTHSLNQSTPIQTDF